MIRKAVINDLDNIMRLNAQLFLDHHTLYDQTLNLDRSMGELGTKCFKESIESEDSCLFVFEKDEQIIGYLAGAMLSEITRKKTILAELENMFVSPSHRNQEIGKKLIDSFKDRAKKHNVDRIRVNIDAENIHAQRFYKRNGFGDEDVIYECVL